VEEIRIIANEIYICYSYVEVVENMRTLACKSICPVYQSHSHPMQVHGEDIIARDPS
jgi:hypothetical protein